MTLQELQAKRDELLQAIGTLRLQYGDRSVEYTADKEKSLRLLDQEIAKLSPQQPSVVVFKQGSRGI